MENDFSECSSEYSDSESCESCCSSSDEEPFFPWVDKVGSRGDLFYIEQNVSISGGHEASIASFGSEDIFPANVKNTEVKLKPSEKFKKWMKIRKRKVRKSFTFLKPNKFNPFNENTYFNQYELPSRDVFVNVKSSRPTLGSRNTLSEQLLGIELGFHDPVETSYQCKLKVLSFTPEEIADIKPGDWLIAINDINVNADNIDDILRGIKCSSTVKITVSTPGIENPRRNTTFHSDHIQQLLGNVRILSEVKSKLAGVPHGILYLVMEDDSTTGNEGLIYKYPYEVTSLLDLKGMFITLSHMISDVASPPLLSCSINVQDELVHVAFVKEGNGTFLLALPASSSTISEVQHFVTNIVKLLKFQFFSLETAFNDGNNKNQLDIFFTLFFKHYLYENSEKKGKMYSHLLEVLPSVHWFPLPTDIKTEIDDILSELESSDYGTMSEGFDGNQRIYSILGSCLFYKGYLLCNHLPKSDLLDIHLYLHYCQILLLTRSEGISEVIIWKEVFPSRLQEPASESVKVRDNRFFMLTVGMQHCILSLILEAGGCSLKAEEFPAPEPFYVEEVQNTLFILHDCGIASAVEKMFLHSRPPLANPDAFFKESASRNNFFSLFSNSSNISSNIKSVGVSSKFSGHSLDKGQRLLDSLTEKKDDLEIERYPMSSLGVADGESDIDSSYSDISNENMSYLEQNLGNSSFASSSTTESQGSSEYSNQQSQVSRLTVSDVNAFKLGSRNTTNIIAGCENTLFQYLHMDPVEGIFLAPVCDLCDLDEIAVKDIQDTFFKCSLKLRTKFARSLRSEEIIKSSTSTKYGVNNFLCKAYEQGVLFFYNKKNSNQRKLINFWVIGRLFFAPEPRELYVCYHDSIQQDIVEMAFRLGFGLST